jgi:acyl-CoA synthetase (AMP-forming)/AMP-acid ligase II
MSEKRPLQAGRMDHSIYPPIERFQTIDGLLRSHAAEQEQRPAICYPVNTSSDFEEHTPAEVDRYTDITAQYYISHGLKSAVSTRSSEMSTDGQ